MRSGRVQSSPSSSTSACRTVIVCPASPCTVNRSQPTRFWPKSSRVSPLGAVQTRCGRSTSCRRIGGDSLETRQSVSKSISCTPTSHCWSARVDGRASTVCPSYRSLARRRGRAGLPRGVRADDLAAAVLVLDLELREPAQLVAVEVAVAVEPEPAAVPAVAEVQPQLCRVGDQMR